jgi:hypothetical protein
LKKSNQGNTLWTGTFKSSVCGKVYKTRVKDVIAAILYYVKEDQAIITC